MRRQYAVGYVVAVDDKVVELRPLAIATRLLPPADRRWSTDWQQVSPSRIDQFASVDWDKPVSHSDLAALNDVPEAEVKAVLAAMIGEPTVPKDWGGERCDLWTTRLRVDGEFQSAAFLLKGPARFAPMTIPMLGKNGDQLERLKTMPAQILVLQHCHDVRPEVFNYLQTVASDFRDVRRFMVIDGRDTYRLLSAYGRLP